MALLKEDALLTFERRLRSRRLASGTVHDYVYEVDRYISFSNVEDVSTLNLGTAQKYIDYMVDRPYSSSSINLAICAIRNFSDVVLNQEYSRSRFPNLVYDEFNPFIFSESQLHDLIEKCLDTKLRAFIALGFDCGARALDVSKLKISHINSKNMTVYFEHSKRNHSRTVKLSEFTLKILREYFKVYRPKGEYLFPGNDQGHISSPTVSTLFKSYVSTFPFYDEKENIRFHCLRHTYAVSMLNQGCNIFLLKKLLGHKSFSSTARYIHLTTRDVEDAFSPSDHFMKK